MEFLISRISPLPRAFSGLTSTHIHHVPQKFCEIMRSKTRGSVQDQAVMLKSTPKELLMREDRLAYRARILETLAAGTGEEVKVVRSQLQKLKVDKERTEEDLKSKELLLPKLEKEREGGQAGLESLEMELLDDQEHIQQLEVQKQELKQEIQRKLEELEALQGESDRKMQELKALSAAEMEVLRKRDELYQAFLFSQMKVSEDIKLEVQATKQDCLHMQNAWQKDSEFLSIDLASGWSEATGDRLKEAQHALGDVVSALAQKSSKLTQLLQNSLAGQAKTLMFVHISPDTESYGETLSALKFAERVPSIELGAARSTKESSDFKEQISMIKQFIAKKFGESDCLQLMRTPSVEETGPVEKPKARPERGFYFHTPVQMNQTRLHRQTLDLGRHKEELDIPTSPKESRRLHDGVAKEKFLDAKKRPESSSTSESRVTDAWSYISVLHIDTEVSLSGVAEKISSVRKPPQPQIPRPWRGEWKALNFGQTHSCLLSLPGYGHKGPPRAPAPVCYSRASYRNIHIYIFPYKKINETEVSSLFGERDLMCLQRSGEVDSTNISQLIELQRNGTILALPPGSDLEETTSKLQDVALGVTRRFFLEILKRYCCTFLCKIDLHEYMEKNKMINKAAAFAQMLNIRIVSRGTQDGILMGDYMVPERFAAGAMKSQRICDQLSPVYAHSGSVAAIAVAIFLMSHDQVDGAGKDSLTRGDYEYLFSILFGLSLDQVMQRRMDECDIMTWRELHYPYRLIQPHRVPSRLILFLERCMAKYKVIDSS